MLNPRCLAVLVVALLAGLATAQSSITCSLSITGGPTYFGSPEGLWILRPTASKAERLVKGGYIIAIHDTALGVVRCVEERPDGLVQPWDYNLSAGKKVRRYDAYPIPLVALPNQSHPQIVLGGARIKARN